MYAFSLGPIKTVEFRGMEIENEYNGEIDERGNACGKGESSYQDGHETYSGCFYNNTWEGIGTLTLPNGTKYEGEFRGGKKHGKMTTLFKKDAKHPERLFNEIYNDG